MSEQGLVLESAVPSGSSRSRRPQWSREPLVHFIAIGALLFAVDAWVAGRSANPRTIVVGVEVDAEAKRVFSSTRGREPNPEELTALRQVWLDNEVLYREGLELQVDRGDTAIRERVIFKALSLVDANVKLPPIDDAGLRAWFEQHRDKYDEPARFDFQEAVLGSDASAADVRHFVRELNAGTPGDAKAGLRVFKGRPHANLVQSYGEEFTAALERAQTGKWQALDTKEGVRAVRLDSAVPAKPAEFEKIGGVIYQDWKDAAATQQRTEAVRTLAKKYEIRFEADAK